MALGIVGNVVRADRQGWVLESDNAAIAISTYDTAHGELRLLGVHSSATVYAGIGDLYHPGPMAYWVQALPAGAFDWSSTALLFTTALINVAAVVVTALFVDRRAGPLVATGAMVATAVMVWGLGPEVVHDPWNPHIAVLPWLLVLVLLWSVVEGDRAALWVLPVAASFTVQNHFAYLPLVGPLGVLALGGLAFELRRRTRDHPDRWRAERRRWLVAGTGATGLGVLCWVPVLVQQLTGDPGNLTQLARFVRGGSPSGRQGVGFGLDRLASFLGAHPTWLDRQLGFFDMVASPTVLDEVVTVGLVGAAVGLGIYHWRRGGRPIARLLAIVLIGLALSAVAAASLPNEISSAAPYNYRSWWPLCALLWFAVAWGVAALPAVAAAGTRTAWVRERSLVQVGALAVVLALATATVARTTIDTDHGHQAFDAIRALNRGLRARLPDRGPWLVVPRGQMAVISLENSVILDLVRHGHPVQITPEREPFLGSFRAIDQDDLAGVLVVASGPGAFDPPPGGREIFRYVPDEKPPALGSFDPAELPVVVYVQPPDRVPPALLGSDP